MKLDRIGAFRAERQSVIDVCSSLSDDEWRAASNADGWRVQDVVSHMSAAFHGFFQPGWLVGLLRTNQLERENDADAAKRAEWDPHKVLAEYTTWSKRAGGTLGFTAKTPMAKTPLRLGEMGKYPMGLFISAFTFDHHTHIHHDICDAIGRPAPATDDNRMAVALEWMFAGMEQMYVENLSFVDRPIAITLAGPGAATWQITPGKKGRLSAVVGSASGAAATISGKTLEFPLWGTTRKPWRDCDVTISGDEDYAQKFLDTLRVV
jgi:hypothetical protein